VLDLLRGERFVDLAPAEVYASLLDENLSLLDTDDVSRPGVGKRGPRTLQSAAPSGLPKTRFAPVLQGSLAARRRSTGRRSVLPFMNGNVKQIEPLGTRDRQLSATIPSPGR
jgi:hypothetical protein